MEKQAERFVSLVIFNIISERKICAEIEKVIIVSYNNN